MFTTITLSKEDKELLKNTIKQEFISFVHETYKFTPSSYGLVYLKIGKFNYCLTDYYENVYIGEYNEETSILRFNLSNEINIQNFAGGESAEEHINLRIESITLVNAKYKLTQKNNTNSTNEITETYGIIFNLLDKYQIAFEKDNFGEIINIYRGYEARNFFNDIKSIIHESYDENYIVDFELMFENL